MNNIKRDWWNFFFNKNKKAKRLVQANQRRKLDGQRIQSINSSNPLSVRETRHAIPIILKYVCEISVNMRFVLATLVDE